MDQMYAGLTGGITIILIVFPAAYRLMRPLIKIKIDVEKSHRLRQTLTIIDKLAYTAVIEMDRAVELNDAERKAAAIHFIQHQLGSLATIISRETIGAKIEEAYQQYEYDTSKNDHFKVSN